MFKVDNKDTRTTAGVVLRFIFAINKKMDDPNINASIYYEILWRLFL